MNLHYGTGSIGYVEEVTNKFNFWLGKLIGCYQWRLSRRLEGSIKMDINSGYSEAVLFGINSSDVCGV
jgi:hypothetical protein